MLDAVRLGPDDDPAAVTAAQVRDVIARLVAAGQWTPGEADILVVVDAGYHAPRLAYLLADLPVEVLGRLRSDRVLRRPAPPRLPGTSGRPPRHGGEFRFADPHPLAPAGHHHHHTHRPLRHRDRHRLGPAAPPAHPPRRLARPPRRAAHPGGHPDPAAGRAPARRPRPQTDLAVEFPRFGGHPITGR